MRNRPQTQEQKEASAAARAAAKAKLKAARALDLPIDLVAGMVHFDLSGNREAVIEGVRGILAYDENIICLDTGKMKVRFMGRDLELRNFTEHSAIIDGFISSIEFLS